jgi:hypothetical protein
MSYARPAMTCTDRYNEGTDWHNTSITNCTKSMRVQIAIKWRLCMGDYLNSDFDCTDCWLDCPEQYNVTCTAMYDGGCRTGSNVRLCMTAVAELYQLYGYVLCNYFFNWDFTNRDLYGMVLQCWINWRLYGLLQSTAGT